MSGALKKPQLRGLIMGQLKKHAAIGFTFSIICAAAWKYGHSEVRKQAYLDHQKNFDEKKEFERMRKAGVFQSVRPDGSIGSL